MKIIYNISDFEKYRNNLSEKDSPVGLVPTMGALHEGHLSLIKSAHECKTIMVSIFVNPNQFNDPKDLKNYPREIDSDLEKLRTVNPDVVFIPQVIDIYPKTDSRKFNFGNLDKVMEGAIRPGHFNGVAQVVSRLFDIFKPDKAYFGQKDFQQLAIIKNLVKKLNYTIDIIPCPIIREKDGLAMSSRNQLLNPSERKAAGLINKILTEAKENRNSMTVEAVKNMAIENLSKIPLVAPEYFEIVDDQSLESISSWDHIGIPVACLAVKINNVRLIDNLIFD